MNGHPRFPAGSQKTQRAALSLSGEDTNTAHQPRDTVAPRTPRVIGITEANRAPDLTHQEKWRWSSHTWIAKNTPYPQPKTAVGDCPEFMNCMKPWTHELQVSCPTGKQPWPRPTGLGERKPPSDTVSRQEMGDFEPWEPKITKQSKRIFKLRLSL